MRSAGTARRPSAAPHGDDLLGLLLDSGLTDREVRDELVTMVIAGHETVAASLTWTLMLLAEDREAQERVRDELAALPGPVSLLDHRDRIPWTRAVIDEALRLFPPAWVISRRSDRDDVLGGVEVPAGTLAIISPWLVHRLAHPLRRERGQQRRQCPLLVAGRHHDRDRASLSRGRGREGPDVAQQPQRDASGHEQHDGQHEIGRQVRHGDLRTPGAA